MIITVHFIGIIIFQILRNRKRLKLGPPAEAELKERLLEYQLKFDPPLFRQRFGTVAEILIQEKWRTLLKKLADFGAAEFGLFMYLKPLQLEEVLFVDIDEDVLMENLFRVEPLPVDCLRRRCCPLEVAAYRGSIVEPDYRLRKTDVVTAIELIEHLYPDTLDALPYNIFSFVKPKLAIFTTPNADFNVVFGRLHGFRHPDHKFEWTSEQFFDWGSNIATRFPDYTVKFQGVGECPEGFPGVGCCSQVAVFVRKDVLSDSYISSDYVKCCQCDNGSPCKGQTVECKLECACLCALCLPDVSVGVCTYLSRNITDSEAYRPMRIGARRCHSDTKLRVYGANFGSGGSEVLNKSHNIFYKLIGTVSYPHEVDPRSDRDRLLDTLKYRIRTFSHVSSRFYVDERERCEIPVRDLVYGAVEVSVDEVGHLLLESGHVVEKCLIPETQELERCVVCTPIEMEDITSSSEVTDGYSSKSSDCSESGKFEPNLEPLSDWDEGPPPPDEQGTSSSSASEPKKPPSADPLVDSGYLKSPSPQETGKSLPQQDAHEPSDLDLFEDIVPTPNLRSDDNKLHLKKSHGNGVANNRPKVLDLNRVNELDRFRNVNVAKTFLKPLRSPPRDFSVAGTSAAWKKPHKKPKATPKEPTALDDAKSLTNCIVQNSLNKIQVEGPVEIIKDIIEGPVIGDVIDAPVREDWEVQFVPFPAIPLPDAVLLPAIPLPPPPQAVENGDLANNNRDYEGNNLPENRAPEQEDVDEGIDLLNDNLEDLPLVVADNVAGAENNNELRLEEPQDRHEEAAGEDRNDDADDLEQEDDSCVARASKEVLYDVNSEQDLLEDFDIPPQANESSHQPFDPLRLTDTDVVLLGIQPIASASQVPVSASIQTNPNSFPDWLLQILGTQVATEEADRPERPAPGHDEPHFYCQGDGLGVHPSVIAVQVPATDDADDSSTDGTSSNGTVDYAEADPGPSDMLDMSSLPGELSDAVLGAVSNLPVDQAAGRHAVASNSAVLVDNVIRDAQEEVAARVSSSDHAGSVQDGSTSSSLTTAEGSVQKATTTVINPDTGSLETSRDSGGGQSGASSTTGNGTAVLQHRVLDSAESVNDSDSLNEEF